MAWQRSEKRDASRTAYDPRLEDTPRRWYITGPSKGLVLSLQKCRWWGNATQGAMGCSWWVQVLEADDTPKKP